MPQWTLSTSLRTWRLEVPGPAKGNPSRCLTSASQGLSQFGERLRMARLVRHDQDVLRADLGVGGRIGEGLSFGLDAHHRDAKARTDLGFAESPPHQLGGRLG